MMEWEIMDTFLSDAYSPEYVLRDKKLFEWMFCDKQNKTVANVICAVKGDTLIGIAGFTPTEFFWGDFTTRHVGAWTANWMVLPQHRGGVGWVLMHRLQKQNSILITQGLGSDNLSITPTLGFKVYEAMPKYSLVFDMELTAKVLDTVHDVWPTEELDNLKNSSLKTSEVLATHITKSITETKYNPNWRCYSSMHYGTIRDLNYIKHRYVNHPYFNYHLFIAGPPDAPALSVCRIEESYGVAKVKVGRILEFFHPEGKKGLQNGFEALLSGLEFIKKQNCAYCDFFCTSSTYGESVIKSGLKQEETLLLPHRLNPLEVPYTEQNLGVISNISPESPTLGDMYVTKSDGDQDRPNHLVYN